MLFAKGGLDSFDAIGQVPIVGDQVGIVVRYNLVVGSRNMTGRGIKCLRQLLEWNPAIPVVLARPAGHRCASVASFADWHAARCKETNIAVAVGVDHVLHWRSKVSELFDPCWPVVGLGRAPL